MNNRISAASPLNRSIASIFLHVTDLRRSAEWYNRLLGLPMLEDRFNGGPVYWYDLPDTHLILDDNAGNRRNPDWRESMKPRLMFKTPDIDHAYAYVKERGEPLGEPEHLGDVMAYFTFRDPEGNAQMVCWTASEDSAVIEPIHGSPIQPRVGAAFIDVKDMAAMASWYADLLGIAEDEYVPEGEIVALPVERGGSLLLDANRHLQYQDFTIPLLFATDDLEASLSYVKDNGFELFGEPEYHGDISFFVLKDPDGNLVMVCRDASVSPDSLRPETALVNEKINGVLVYVRDIEAAAGWYERMLGFERGAHDYDNYCELTVSGSYVMHLLLAEEGGEPMRRPAFSLDTTDLAEAHRSLSVRGAIVHPIRQYGDHRSFDFEDLEGNRLMITQFDRDK
ncbi:VOC family protein [Cohnella sp. GCM10027633]|uniref:VOC family protein n=1 Tax=unclassified Cohnella TaxID=2636738 RepID=UPI003627A151